MTLLQKKSTIRNRDYDKSAKPYKTMSETKQETKPKGKSDPKSERYNEKAPDYKMYLSKDPDEASDSNSQPSEPKAEAVAVVENEEVL